MENETTVTVETPFGTIRGLQRGPTQVFKGIRFATAERFCPPQPVTGWAGEYDATAYRSQCPQSIGMMEQALGTGPLPMDEDCLHLNVFTPGCGPATRPVLVWIHGGGFTSGTGAMPWYDGSALCALGDVVVVTLNYRLGALGYAGPGNFGTHDQVAALRWVNQQIAAFGGDPGNVTIFGESAGGSAVVSLLAVPAATGLFQRGFAMSPSIKQLRSRDRAEAALADYLLAAKASSLAELAQADVGRILDAQAALLREGGAGFTGFSPCTDGDLIPDPMLEAAAANPTPLVLGTTRDEMALFTAFDPTLGRLDDGELNGIFDRRFGEGADAARALYATARPGHTLRQIVSAMQTDEMFRVPAQRLAEQRVTAGSPTWMYWFTWATPAFGGVLGSCHAVDIPFAFHNLDRKGVPEFTGTSAQRTAVADAYSGAVLAFARTGDPGWQRYDTVSRPTRRFDLATETIEDPEHVLRELWMAS
ncbi:MAG: carboxylesterase family protein [Ilumatobacteraceae bacterium]